MRTLTLNEQKSVSGADLGESMFNGFLIGSTTGAMAGALAGVYCVVRYPLIAVVPGMLENAVKTGAIVGVCAGGICGMFAGIILDDD